MSRTKRSSSMSSGHYFPEGVIYNILSCTKVTSLLRFKSVCSLWRSMISKPTFFESHHPNSLKYPSILMITSRADMEEEEAKCRLAATIVYSDSRVNLPLPSVFDTMKFVSSCNGIVCVCDAVGDVIYLFNPLTRLSKRLPPAPIPVVALNNHPVGVLNNHHHHQQQEKPFKVDVVFGFDCVLHDFKVLRIKYRSNVNSQLVSVLVVELYSSNADSWKEIHVDVTLPAFLYYPFCPVLMSGPVLDGVLYLEGMNEIVTFDLHNEMFGLISLPSFMKTRKSNVLDVEGSIAVVVESVGDGLVDKEICVWTMEKISDEVFWNKSFKFDADLGINWVFLYLGAKQFVVRTKLGEMLYDHSKKEATYIGLPSQSFLTRVLKHAESFISIEGFEQVEEN